MSLFDIKKKRTFNLYGCENRLLLNDPLHCYISFQILHSVLYEFPMILTRRIRSNHVLLEFVIISSILVTLVFDVGLILLRDVRFLSLLGFEGVRKSLKDG